MLRWIFLLIVLANALLFFWYAQTYHFSRAETPKDFKPSVLRLPSELNPGEVLESRERECAVYSPLASEYEASRLASVLEQQGYAVDFGLMPEVADGVRLEIPLPADAQSRIRLLDDLARVGWVPESRDGVLVLGNYADEAALAKVRSSLPDNISKRARGREVMRQSGDFEVRTSYLAGYEIGSEIKQLISQSWPGVKFEKNPCEGVATPLDHQ